LVAIEKVVFSKLLPHFKEIHEPQRFVYSGYIPLIYFFMKALLLELNLWLYGKIKMYAEERGISVVGAIRLILSEFFRSKSTAMNKGEELPEGIFDMGEGKGYLIDMERLRDKDGYIHAPPANLSKEQTLEWIRKYHNGKTTNDGPR
jgi:hypothetical protein